METNDMAWTREEVLVCDGCNKPMIPNISTYDDEGYGWSCTTYGCGDFTGGEIEAEDLIALGVPEWVAERMEALSNAVLEMGE
jgi:hypothetical protein